MSLDKHNDDAEFLVVLIKEFNRYLDNQSHNINKTSDLIKAYRDFFKGQL